jgi:MerR family transcriptional regulator, light-induced transcriptional regulator
MGKQNTSLDPDVFARTAALFATKRRVLDVEVITVLAGDILRHVSTQVVPHAQFPVPEVAEDSLSAFCDLLVRPEPTAALRFIEERRAEGMSQQDIYLGFVGAAARRLGKGWEDSELSFLEVTVGVGHLYALMRALRSEWSSARALIDGRRRALFATVPGEDHGLGITIAADLFRVAGWDIDLQTGLGHDGLLDFVRSTRPPIIGLSLSSERRLADLVRLVVALRIESPLAIIGVAPAATMDADMVADMVDIDLVFRDADSARADLDRLIRLRG